MSVDYIHWLRQRIGHQRTIIVYASLVALDSQGRVLLQQRADTHTWGLPGGILEPGEGLLACARRELKEETGLSIGELRLVGLYTGPRYNGAYPNGDLVQQYTVCFTGALVAGELAPDPEESLALAYFTPEQLAHLPLPVFYADMLRDAWRVRQGAAPFYEPPQAAEPLVNVIDQVRPHIGTAPYIGAAAAAAVLDEAGRLLVVRRSDNGEWSIPGGYMHLGETVAHAAQREVREETGLEIEPLALLGISALVRPWVYPNGDQAYAVIAMFRARVTGGSPQPDRLEVNEIGWMTCDELLAVNTHPNLQAINRAVVQALQRPGAPYVI
ncbi:MAG: NUDIX domain-containing protein [Chloroflexota bacterium]